VLVGATASGKSACAIPLARALGAEIVSLDSMLLYRGMDVGTDKPVDRGGVPHHLIDILDPLERFDLARYISAADEAIADIRGRGRIALVVGGTGLYLMGLLKGVFAGAPRDAAFRDSLGGEETRTLHRRLLEVDPEAAARLHPNDRRRILRALEVTRGTGRPIGELQRQFGGPDRHETILAGIRREREDLRARIRARVDAMFRAGLVEEVRGLRLGPTAGQAVGYKEVAAALRGECDLAEARRRIESHTIRLVRRQGTWFRRFPVRWVDAAPGEGPETLVPRLLEAYRGSTSDTARDAG
jgi:tRNA dimethylallyltransferase